VISNLIFLLTLDIKHNIFINGMEKVLKGHAVTAAVAFFKAKNSLYSTFEIKVTKN